MEKLPKNGLSFFKVFMKETASDKLKISRAVSSHMLETLLHGVSLRDKYGNVWSVKLTNIDNELHFEEGWAKFVEDNSIEDKDFLFFQFDDDKLIDVKLIGRGECGKRGVGAPRSSQDREETIDVEMEDVNDIEMEGQENESIGEQVDEEDEEDDDEDVRKQENRRFQKQLKRELSILRKEVATLTRKVGETESKDTNGGSRKSSRMKELPVQKPAGAKRGRRKNPDYYGSAIFRSGILPLPKNPYFVAGVRPKRREELYVPIEVLKDIGVTRLPPKATLRDSKGRTWVTYRTKWHDGREFFVGGWASFCRMNFVGDNDQCVCEFVKGNKKNELIIQIQVVPTINNAKLQKTA